jgi:hypothetical protein
LFLKSSFYFGKPLSSFIFLLYFFRPLLVQHSFICFSLMGHTTSYSQTSCSSFPHRNGIMHKMWTCMIYTIHNLRYKVP